MVICSWLDERRFYPSAAGAAHLFVSDRHNCLSRKQAWNIIRQCGADAGITIEPHPHMLRHACGYALANKGADTRLIQDYLGHKNIRHTVHYTKSSPSRFDTFMQFIDG